MKTFQEYYKRRWLELELDESFFGSMRDKFRSTYQNTANSQQTQPQAEPQVDEKTKQMILGALAKAGSAASKIKEVADKYHIPIPIATAIAVSGILAATTGAGPIIIPIAVVRSVVGMGTRKFISQPVANKIKSMDPRVQQTQQPAMQPEMFRFDVTTGMFIVNEGIGDAVGGAIGTAAGYVAGKGYEQLPINLLKSRNTCEIDCRK